jgi:microcystin-dependent protein
MAEVITSNKGTFPPGIILAYPSATAPTGWLLCNGQAVSRTTYADLFAVISTNYGVGDGSTTFNLPDYRGMFLRGAGTNGTHQMADGNYFAGPALHGQEDDQVQGHWHENKIQGTGGSTTTHQAVVNGQPFLDNSIVNDPVSDGVNGTPRTGDETRPANYGVNYIIKV